LFHLDLLGRQRKPERRADPFLAFDGHLPAVSLDKRLHDGETKTHSTRVLRIGFSLVKDFFDKFVGDSSTVVIDPALNGTFRLKFRGPDDNLSARRVLDRIGD